jgi:hypothetical protein
MKPNQFMFISIVAILALQACSVFYFGHTREEWKNLNEEEKLAAKAEYQEAINLREEQKHSDKLIQEQSRLSIMVPAKPDPFRNNALSIMAALFEVLDWMNLWVEAMSTQ